MYHFAGLTFDLTTFLLALHRHSLVTKISNYFYFFPFSLDALWKVRSTEHSVQEEKKSLRVDTALLSIVYTKK